MPDSVEFSASARDPVAPDAATTGVFPQRARRYRAFISYSHADTPWANWLLKKLEGYRVPARFHGRAAPVGEVGPRLAPVFRDRDELPTTSDLGETIRAALRESATLIVICSPSSAKSRWVQEEIIAFKRLHGERRVFALIVAGEPKAEGTADDCFSPALRRELAPDGTLTGAPAEVVAADARPHADGKGAAFVRLVAGLLGVGFDELRQRELQRRNRRLTLIAAASVVGMVLTLGLALAAWRARGDAQRRQDQAEDVLAFMLGDFREDLKKVGQLALLEKVGNKAQAYFDEAAPRDLTDLALARQAKALTQIGEVKLLQKDVSYAEAARAFSTAYKRAAELAVRHPQNGDVLFERAQAEFWIGNVHYRRGDFVPAGEWLGRYRDSASALVALDAANPKWRRELVSSSHNLAVLDLERGDLAAARQGFLVKMESVRRLAEANPKDSLLRFQITDTDSYLGTLAARSGDLTEAGKRFAMQRAGLEALVQAEPATAQWTFKLAECLLLESEIMAIGANVDAARDWIARGMSLIGPLLARDPTNRRWLGLLATCELRDAAIQAVRDPIKAAQVLAGALSRSERMAAAEPQDRIIALRLLSAWRLEAQVRLAVGRRDAADAAARALAIGEPLLQHARSIDRTAGEVAQSLIVAGRIAAVDGQNEAALAFWQRAAELLAPRIINSSDWCLLDPAARVYAHLGRNHESRSLVERLQNCGYVPLEPWPSTLVSAK